MAELSRITQAIARSMPRFGRPISRWPSCPPTIAPVFPVLQIMRPMSTTLRTHHRKRVANSPRPTNSPLHPRVQSRSYASNFDWLNPGRDPRPAQDNQETIKKPNMAAYENPLDEDPAFGPDFDVTELAKTQTTPQRQALERPPLRLVARTGRTIHVRQNVDVGRSLKLLAVQINQNKVRQDFQQQRFHERPGLKRKRLKSQRWQKRFKRGFKAAISRVKELTKQGW
ncbi:hypothetical protein GGS23DRAFT_119996 [Durotheca rogersii]|uniref:uncharacterized protein n=1 Tax=Durotheca rogersii TaxID=419775 RepID=UPI00221F333E|nr:uncharacterized protein GGS23DRAFT_119996 [Durotheca rogersii]KAI5861944.1 hypothetical protein GGS23DRAFT_119996 [Durotheca rogersii]